MLQIASSTSEQSPMGRLLARVGRILRGKLESVLESGGVQGSRSAHPAPQDENCFDGGAASELADEVGLSASPRSDAELRAFGILEIAPGALPGEIHSAYRRLSRRYHPDRFVAAEEKAEKANELMAEINRAYALLRTDSR